LLRFCGAIGLVPLAQSALSIFIDRENDHPQASASADNFVSGLGLSRH
jgi:hypothetical protein